MENEDNITREGVLAETNNVFDKVFKSNFGQTEETIRVTFKKTVQIKEYQTEVVEGSTELKLDKPVSGAERELIMAMLRLQLEYEAYVSLLQKGLITQRAFEDRKIALFYEVTSIRDKVEGLGVDVDKYF